MEIFGNCDFCEKPADGFNIRNNFCSLHKDVAVRDICSESYNIFYQRLKDRFGQDFLKENYLKMAGVSVRSHSGTFLKFNFDHSELKKSQEHERVHREWVKKLEKRQKEINELKEKYLKQYNVSKN